MTGHQGHDAAPAVGELAGSSEHPAGHPAGGKPLVLVAQHEHFTARLWEFELRRGGFDVVVRSTVEAAERASEEAEVDLAVVDLQLPGGGSADLCHLLKEHGDRPVLAVSRTTAGAPAGIVDAILTKPLDRGHLVRTARNLLAGVGWDLAVPASGRSPRGTGAPGALPPVDDREALVARVAELEAEVSRLTAHNADLERFAAEVAHDLAQPLLTAGGYLVILEFQAGESLEGPARTALQAAIESVNRMNVTLRALRELSGPGNVSDPPSTVDLSLLVKQVLEDLAPAVETSGAEVTVGDLPVVEGYPELLARMLTNIVSNALKYTRPDVRPRVGISGQRFGSRWQIRVDDNGIGIPPERRQEVFRPFSRLSQAAELEGSGLGLAIAKRAADRHNASISIEDRPGGGSRFVIEAQCCPRGSPVASPGTS